MIDLTKAILPSAVEVDGNFYGIKTDFQYWINFSNKLQNNEIKNFYDCDFLYVNKKPLNREEGSKKLMEFYLNKHKLPRPVSGGNGRVCFDYVEDADYVYSAFLEQYGIDLINPELHLHWWKFTALLHSLHGTKLNEIMDARGYDENDKTEYKKAMIMKRRQWELERKLTPEEQAALDRFDALLN